MQTFLAGVFAVLPLVITVAVVIWVTGRLADMFGPHAVIGQVLQNVGLRFASSKAFAYVIGWMVVLGGVFGLGLLVQMGARALFEERMDELAQRVPLVGGVYRTVRQLVRMMDKKGGQQDLRGMSVVFCIFGRETGAAFLALLTTPQRFRIGEIDYHAVLVPTAPLPLGGSLIFVPANAVHPAHLSVDAFMSIYVSMGVTGPQFLKGAPAVRDALLENPPA
jgi:uncharacterized membrane protein